MWLMKKEIYTNGMLIIWWNSKGSKKTKKSVKDTWTPQEALYSMSDQQSNQNNARWRDWLKMHGPMNLSHTRWLYATSMASMGSKILSSHPNAKYSCQHLSTKKKISKMKTNFSWKTTNLHDSLRISC